MLILQNISYRHPDKEVLFENIHLTVHQHDKIALIGNNGAGKSTLLRIMARALPPAGGSIGNTGRTWYIPQLYGQYNGLTVAQALGIHHKLDALRSILQGDVSIRHMNALDDDWTIEERCREALDAWHLKSTGPETAMDTLSGGQKTRVFLAGITLHDPTLVLLDEPSNHLDDEGRDLLYQLIRSWTKALVVVSHDRTLLNLLRTVCELSPQGLTTYGGNFDFYTEQKKIRAAALEDTLREKEKALKKAEAKERETMERQRKLDARGKQKQQKEGVARIMMNTLRNNAEKSTSKTQSVHTEKISGLAGDIRELRSQVPDPDKMKLGFGHSGLHKGKILFAATGINFRYNEQKLWKEDLTFEICSGERIAVKGANGSGKTTLVKIITGGLEPMGGQVHRAAFSSIYIDQEYSLVASGSGVYELAQQFNHSFLEEHEVRNRLNRFLFTREDWNKSCAALSGGERMRLALCCLTLRREPPDLIVLDEPTNNLDIQNIEILTHAIRDYRGSLLVISHDRRFLEEAGIQRLIGLK